MAPVSESEGMLGLAMGGSLFHVLFQYSFGIRNDPFGFPRRRFNIAGTKGGMEIQPMESGKFVLNLDQAHQEYKKGTQTVQLKSGRSYVAEFVDLAKVIWGEKKLEWSYEHGLTVHETLLKICKMTLD